METPNIEPVLMAKAEERFRQRFQRLDLDFASAQAMLRLGLDWLPRDVDLFPEACLAVKVPYPGPVERIPFPDKLAKSADIPTMPQVLLELQGVLNTQKSGPLPR